MYRQGDVLLIPRKAPIPKKAKRAEENGTAVLAHGEATGHSHAFPTGDHRVQLFRDSEGAYLRVKAEAPLQHQEHSTIVIPPGNYDVVRQVEYSPEAIRNVAD